MNEIQQLQTRVNQLTDAILDLSDQQGQVTERQVIAQRYGVNDARVLDRYQELKSEGKDFEAHDLLYDAQAKGKPTAPPTPSATTDDKPIDWTQHSGKRSEQRRLRMIKLAAK